MDKNPVNLPVLPPDDNVKADHDIPKRWTNEDMVKRLVTKSFQNGQFGIIVIGVFIRWYDRKSTVKERRERDKWQLWMDVSEIELIKVCPWKILTYCKSQRIWKIYAEKGNGKILFRTFRELVFSDYVGSSYLSVPDPLGHGWSLDGLVEKETNMSKEEEDEALSEIEDPPNEGVP
ncbi:hypothetical protein RhiirA1_468442 [Rhizophagus irregularis]|uniref:Uncharacterized protein n=1 Tax=Rhizophagus irregularis TaxID=588596 RepID=A0A2N0RA28_9GLOM|nr:hypothetical protein RhiirA1_468442 [Rhizophagus irregularis]